MVVCWPTSLGYWCAGRPAWDAGVLVNIYIYMSFKNHHSCPIGVRAHSTRGMASSWAWSETLLITPLFSKSSSVPRRNKTTNTWKTLGRLGNKIKNKTRKHDIQKQKHMAQDKSCQNIPLVFRQGKVQTVYDIKSPKPTVTINPDTQVFIGETVTFRCDVQKGRDTEWTYGWFRDSNRLYPYSTTKEFSIRSVTDSHRGQYTCRGRRTSDYQMSQMSDSVTLSVSKSPKPTVTINPDTQVFMGETVTFRCDVQKGRDTEWTYEWFWDSNAYPYPTTNEFSISYVTVSHRGQYTCRGRRTSDSQMSEMSDPVTLSVSSESVNECYNCRKGFTSF
ncbi:hypothetical protein Q7C36_004351 [Tachysurus vachellii]|uniref:Ig-like domain-containing protein n=1 Tax=Tachysurus vachellii TaxID=175792 RepID=A0AA88NN88_TACVA|nr:hypothetical protein Q7C36_004351 [Tachysurus vachellii]